LFLQGDTKLTFIPGSPVYADVTASQTKIWGDGSSTATLDVTVKDGLHFPIVGSGTAVITVSRGSVLPTTTLVSDGQFGATFTADRSVGMVDVDISYNGVLLSVQGDTLELISGVAYSATLSASATEIHVDSSEKSTLKFSLFDQWNNPVPPGTAVTVTSSIGNISPASASTTGNMVAFTLTPAAAAGPVTFNVSASSGANPLQLSGNTVTILPGSIHHIAITPSVPVWVTAGGSTSFTAIGYDKYDNQTSTGPFNWRKVYGSGDGVLNSGVFTGTLAGTLGIQAYTGTIYSPEKSVTIVPGPLASTIVSANPLTVPIGGVPSQLTITARDAYGNLVSDGTSALVTTDLGTITGSGATKNGALTRTLLSSNFSGRAHIYINGKAAQGDTVFFAPRAWMTAIPSTMVADGTSRAEIRIRELDSNGLPTGNIPSVVTSTMGTLNYNDCTTDVDVLVCTLIASTELGQAYIYADGYPAQGVVTFTTGTPSRAHISANPAQVAVQGLSTSTLTISVQDAYGHTITNYSNPLTVNTSLGTLNGTQPTVNGVTQRILSGGSTAGTATISVSGLTVIGDRQIPVVDVVARISSSEPYLVADGQDSTTLTITLEDANGQSLTNINALLSVSTSLGTISGFQPTINGVTQRTLAVVSVGGSTPAPASVGGMAEITVAGMQTIGDNKIQFVGDAFVDGDFENGFTNWIVGTSYSPITATKMYSSKAVSNDVVGTILVTPHGTGKYMARLGAITSDNSDHALGDTWLRQAVYVPATGVTQIAYWYRLLSYDVSTGSQDLGYLEWDPFKVYLNGQKVWQDSDAHPERIWSWEWQQWRDGPPDPPLAPKDGGWRQGVLDVTPFAGQVVSIEFRLSNSIAPEDNTWVYIDDISVLHQDEQNNYNVFIPLVMK
jgi:adhesin/invasin